MNKLLNFNETTEKKKIKLKQFYLSLVIKTRFFLLT